MILNPPHICVANNPFLPLSALLYASLLILLFSSLLDLSSFYSSLVPSSPLPYATQLLLPRFASVTTDDYKRNLVARGLPASPGAAVGVVALSPEAAEASYSAGVPCLLVRDDTSPEDVGGESVVAGTRKK